MSTERIQHERELFERYKKQRAPGVNLQRIGAEYVDLDVQWHFETWLARANMPQPAAPVAQAEPVATVVERKEGSRTWFDGVIHATAIVMGKIKDGDPLYATPPAPDAALVEALRNMLSDDDIRHLRRFQEICEDSDADGHDLPKEAVRRLERAGALRSCGFGRHETTLFGDAILAALAGKGAAQ